MTSAADRQRRSRAHRKGEHAHCDPSRCDQAPVTPVTTVTRPGQAPSHLGPRGRRLWRETTAEGSLSPADLVNLEEACRIADRLDKLDSQIRGDEKVWMHFRSMNEDGSIVKVVMTAALAESRQQAIALNQITKDLRAAAKANAKPDAPTKEAPSGVLLSLVGGPDRSRKSAS